jgi:hypothetical protein
VQPTIVGSQGVTFQTQGSCLSATSYTGDSQLRLQFIGPGSVAITPDADGTLDVSLVTVSDPAATTSPRSFTLSAEQTAYLNVTASGVAPVISLPAGPSLLCGIAEG